MQFKNDTRRYTNKKKTKEKRKRKGRRDEKSSCDNKRGRDALEHTDISDITLWHALSTPLYSTVVKKL